MRFFLIILVSAAIIVELQANPTIWKDENIVSTTEKPEKRKQLLSKC